MKCMVGTSIDDTLSQRRQLIEEALLSDITSTLTTIKNLRTETVDSLKKLNFMMLSMLNKTVLALSQFYSTHSSPGKLDFLSAQILLQSSYTNQSQKLSQLSLLFAKEISIETSPSLEAEIDHSEVS